MKYVQLMATVRDEFEGTRAATPDEMSWAEWSVYLGKPGAFEWQADFREFIVAECFAIKLCADHDADLIRGGA